MFWKCSRCPLIVHDDNIGPHTYRGTSCEGAFNELFSDSELSYKGALTDRQLQVVLCLATHKGPLTLREIVVIVDRRIDGVKSSIHGLWVKKMVTLLFNYPAMSALTQASLTEAGWTFASQFLKKD